MGENLEQSITAFANDNGMSREDYLSVINKWPHWNKKVMDIMEKLGSQLRHQVAEVLGSETAWPVGAVVFRKTSFAKEAGNVCTHSHQDIACARFPGSQLFRATTWVPLVLRNGDTMCFAVGSHKRGIRTVEDFLLTTTSKAQITVECDEDVNVTLGDCILFDARVYHASTPFPLPPANFLGPSLRLAIGIQWCTPGGLDGLKPGVYFLWSEKDIPQYVDLENMRKKKVFGMDTAGYFLKMTLVTLDQRLLCSSAGAAESFVLDVAAVDVSKRSTLDMVTRFCNKDDHFVVDTLRAAGCNVVNAQEALNLYVTLRKAARRHFGDAQGPKIFKPLYEYLIQQVLYLRELDKAY